jgi:phosphoglycolate phosphatase-like HAD superfamily hydrolase
VEKLILWDIDGTLIYSGGVAGEAMRAAMERVYGRATSAERHAYAGKTDQQIILETFAERAHADLLPLLEQFTATYLAELEARREEFLARGYVLEGVVAALERLAGAPVVQSLLTGNLRPVARFKLDLLGLTRYFDFDAGAYGSDHYIRANLAPIATERAARRYSRPFVGRDVVVIGDTPNDIDCGRAAGARTIAVASGPFGLDELRAHGADVALANLADTEAVIAAILEPHGRGA